ncbi:hypothetical protein Pla110_32000 [Polystyrenella longa]|uniref:DUF4350 domain-containing protein n=1 Tax=Polystyrenella longa TaxID=2528007 RepID=A0A518CQF4_9PLAN|nr:hypothetical protein [Polystyrenella longa]QDU81459.1 hypothetical protein Pla110_32000 [Polystyrenella longa]
MLILLTCLTFFGSGVKYVVAQEKPAASFDDVRSEVKIDAVSVGLDGVYKIGRWAPVEVTVSVSQPGDYQLELVSVDADGAPFAVSSAQNISAAGTHTLSGKFLPGRMEADLTVRMILGESVLAERSFPSSKLDPDSIPVAQKQSLFVIGVIHPTETENGGTAAKEPSPNSKKKNWPENFINSQRDSMTTNKPTRAITLNSVEELPNDLDTLRLFDALIIAEGFDLPPEQEQLLQKWIQAGGHLMVMIGDQVEQWQAGSLSKWVPVKINGENNLKHLGDLENYVGQGRLARMIIDVARIEPDSLNGKVEIASIEGPLVVKSAYGFGAITVSSIDLTQMPLSNWESLPLFFSKIFQRVPNDDLADDSRSGKNLVHAGISSLRTQLQGTLDQFEATRNLSAWEVMIRILGLIILLGPLDYLLTHKILKRPGLTWISFPLMLGIVVLLTFRKADNMHHETPLLRQVNMIDFDAQSGLNRNRVWQSYYSPQSEQVSASVTPLDSSTVNADNYLSIPRTRWSGTPEENFSGMYRTPGISFGLPRYDLSLTESIMTGIPIGQWSSKVIETDWLESSDPKALIESDLSTNTSGRLSGTLKHHFPVPLEEWFIAYENQAYLPRSNRKSEDLVPLETDVEFKPDDRKVIIRTIKNYLTNRIGNSRQKEQDVLATALDEYEVLSTDPYSILRAATFYETVGGEGYYTLSNDSFAGFDLSPQLDMKRAVLFGMLNLPVSTTKIDDQAIEPVYRKTIVRILLPVK